MLMFSQKVFEGGVSGAGSSAAAYSKKDLDRFLAQADRFFVQVRASQVSGTGPKVTVDLQSSNDGVDWNNVTLAVAGISDVSVVANQVTLIYGNAVDATKVLRDVEGTRCCCSQRVSSAPA